MSTDRIVGHLSARGLTCEVSQTPCGGSVVTFDFGVLCCLHGQQEWHWSVVQSPGTRAGEGSFVDDQGCEYFLRHLQPRRAHGSTSVAVRRAPLRSLWRPTP